MLGDDCSAAPALSSTEGTQFYAKACGAVREYETNHGVQAMLHGP